MPSMEGIAIGLATSAPAPVDHRVGRSPINVVAAVIIQGRILLVPAINIGGNENGIITHNTKDGNKTYPDSDTEVIANRYRVLLGITHFLICFYFINTGWTPLIRFTSFEQ